MGQVGSKCSFAFVFAPLSPSATRVKGVREVGDRADCSDCVGAPFRCGSIIVVPIIGDLHP